MITALEIILFVAVIFGPVALIVFRIESERRRYADYLKRTGGPDGGAGGGGDNLNSNLTSVESHHAGDHSPGTMDPGSGGHGGHGCGGHGCGGGHGGH